MTKLAPVSVIVPTAGRPQIIRALESVIAQSVQVSEIIVIVDGRKNVKPDLVEQIGKLCENHLQLFVLEHQSGGPAKPRNIALAAARNPLVAFLDDDDWWMNDKIERQLSVFNDDKVVAVGTNAISWSNGQELGQYFKPATPRAGITDLAIHNPLILSTVIARKEALLEVGGFPESSEFRGIDDYLAWRRLSMIGKIINLNQSTIYYRKVDEDSLSTAPEAQHKDPAKTAWKYLAKYGHHALCINVKFHLWSIIAFGRKILSALRVA